MIIIWNYYLTYSIALDLPSISKKEMTDFLSWNIYNVELLSQTKNENNNEHKIIKKFNYNNYLEDIQNEIQSEISKY